jgi:sialate O-acetylesterase
MKWYLISILLLLNISLFGQLKVAPVFSSNMILQREQPIHIWGDAEPGSKVLVIFNKRIAICTTNSNSHWSIFFPAQLENDIPQTITVKSGDQTITLSNILIGDIWVCIGQSNMEFPLGREAHWKEEKLDCQQSTIRILNPPPAGRNVYNTPFNDSIINRLNNNQFYQWNEWQVCDSNTAKTNSAVAYYFAKKVANTTNIPIGIINLSLGGAPLETFISTASLLHHPILKNKVNGNWLTNESLPTWIKERGNQNTANNNKIPSDEYGPMHGYKPGVAYEAGILPLTNLPIKGILNYQGESNAQELERVNEYAELSKLMIEDYRRQWKQPDLPYFFVQLSSIDTVKYKGQLWGAFRDEQRKSLAIIENSGMAVCSDIGAKDDVHPTNKKNVGERLAFWALNKTYNEQITPSGPLPLKAVYKNGSIVITYKYASNGLKTTDGMAVKGFSLDGSNNIEAVIEKDQIIIPCKAKPEYIYYGWKSFSDGNLANSENLPASTFKLAVK